MKRVSYVVLNTIYTIRMFVMQFIKDKRFLWEECSFILLNGYEPFPYFFVKKYKKMHIEVYRDTESAMPYVIHNGRLLFFPLNFSEEQVKKTYCSLLSEQDCKSPHYYWNPYNAPEKDDIFVDIGSAEGMIALDQVEKCSKVLLVEADDNWVAALKKTFEPYKEKVEIINKYCTDNNECGITIDELIDDISGCCVIKMDIEGYEQMALAGAQNALRRKDIKWAVCLYHQWDDSRIIRQIFDKNHLSYELSHGYYFMNSLKYPFFTDVMLRGWGKDIE